MVKHVTVAMFINASAAIAKQTYIEYICRGTIILEKELHSQYPQGPDTQKESTPIWLIILQRGKERVSGG